jgi:hypothetical protein
VSKTASEEKKEVTIERVVTTWNEIPGVKPTPLAKINLELWKRLNQRIYEHKSWGWWETLFQLVRHSKFLTGQKSGAEDFHVSLWWILGPKNLAKVLMGEYTDFQPTKGAMPNGYAGASKLEHWANEWDTGPDLPGHPGSAEADASTP